MINLILLLLAGWPAIIITLILAGIGLFKNNYRFLLWAAILSVPFSWYLAGFPIIRSPVFLTPVLVFCSAWAMRYDRQMISWIFAILFFLVIVLLLFVLMAGGA
jgi:hypothetical protein